jgi:hypothetical protein
VPMTAVGSCGEGPGAMDEPGGMEEPGAGAG